jgi:hypothetical protein
MRRPVDGVGGGGRRRALLALVALGVLAGCAADPRASQGLRWVIEQEEERKQYDKAGFPQYNDS